MWIYLIYYLILINLISFVFFGVDKLKAKKGWWRISESILLGLTLIGGFFGALLGMIAFGHKTIKSSFQLRFRLIILMWIIVVIYYLIIY